MDYVVTSHGQPDYFEHGVSVGDVVNYSFDFTPWLEGKGDIDTITWSTVLGNASFSSDETSAYITFNNPGQSVVTCSVLTENGDRKKVWLIIKAREPYYNADDYGFGS